MTDESPAQRAQRPRLNALAGLGQLVARTLLALMTYAFLLAVLLEPLPVHATTVLQYSAFFVINTVAAMASGYMVSERLAKPRAVLGGCAFLAIVVGGLVVWHSFHGYSVSTTGMALDLGFLATLIGGVTTGMWWPLRPRSERATEEFRADPEA